MTQQRSRGSGWKAVEWLLGVVGAVALFLGLFTVFGPADEYVGLGGEWSWRVGDIADAWTYGMVVTGAVMLLGLGWMVLAGRQRVPIEPSPFEDLAWHAGVFILVNAFVWAQDLALGSGLDYALWVTIPWAIGLAFHAYVTSRSRTRLPSIEDPVSGRQLQRH